MTAFERDVQRALNLLGEPAGSAATIDMAAATARPRGSAPQPMQVRFFPVRFAS